MQNMAIFLTFLKELENIFVLLKIMILGANPALSDRQTKESIEIMCELYDYSHSGPVCIGWNVELMCVRGVKEIYVRQALVL